MKYLFLVLVALLFACVNIPYQDDVSFTGSAVANSPEVYVKVNGKECRDLDLQYGQCILNTKSNMNLTVATLPMMYPAELTFDCSRVVQPYPEIITVKMGEPHTFTLLAVDLAKARLFSCSLKIVPLDRPEPIASIARVIVNVVDSTYTRLPMPAIDAKGNLITGQYAKYIYYADAKGWHQETEKTYIKSKSITLAFVESYAGRWAIWRR